MALVLHVDHLSWWCGLTRQEFHDAVSAHVVLWRNQRKGVLDYVGAQLQRDNWEPRRDPSHPRQAMK